MQAEVKARPTTVSEGSATAQCRRAEAVSSVAASGRSVRASVQVTVAGRCREPRAVSTWLCTQVAFSWTSRPVSTRSTLLRNPPNMVTETLRASGGSSPRVPEIRTRSGASCSSRTVSSRTVASGPR